MSRPPAVDLRARKAALREALAPRRAAAQAELARRRAALKPKEDPKKKRRWWPILLALLLLLLLHDCRCEPDPVPEPPAAPTQGEAMGGVGTSVEAPPPPPDPGRVSRRARPAYAPTTPEPLPWINALRLQVAARSTRLAACFVGVAQPGALKWTASVDPGAGRVSDQTLEPTLSSEALSAEQRDCALGVLAEPPYRLLTGEGSEARSTPSRVGMVIEF